MYISGSVPIPAREATENDDLAPWPGLMRFGVLTGLVAASWGVLIGLGDLVAHLV